MADLKRCKAGKNSLGAWHIACAEPAAPPLLILQNMKHTNNMSPDMNYYKCARWICNGRGTQWSTNALGVPTPQNCTTLPPVDPF